MTLSLAPLQTYTDHHFRNAFQQVFSGVDTFYAPYLKLNNDGSIKPNTKIDVLPENNPFQPVIPQVMACSAKDFFTMADYLRSLGYAQLNWNMGCPYPMVTNRNLGAGILDKPEELKNMLNEVYSRLDMQLGIKMRMGLESTVEILDLLPILNEFPLTEVIIHGRYARQLYTGNVDRNRFEECLRISGHPLVFNGDVTTAEEADEIMQRFPAVKGIMIGRGAMINPSLFEEIASGSIDDASAYREKLYTLSEYLLESTARSNPDKGYPLGKLKSYWEYLCDGLSDGKQLFRKLKKCDDTKQFFMHLDAYLRD